MKIKQWYELLFEVYEKNTSLKVSSRERWTNATSSKTNSIKILTHEYAISVVTGRQPIELIKRGYDVTGADLLSSPLKRAKEKAATLGLRIDFQQHNARELPFDNTFDLEIMLCEGAFPLMETDEINYPILQCIEKKIAAGSPIGVGHGKCRASCLRPRSSLRVVRGKNRARPETGDD